VLKEKRTSVPLYPLINSARIAMGLNRGHCSEKLATNCMSVEWPVTVMYVVVMWEALLFVQIIMNVWKEMVLS
jgi:hypothetical protein